MITFEDRLGQHRVYAYLAMDTIDALFDRIVGIVGTVEQGRRMTVISDYSDTRRHGTSSLEIKTGQTRAKHGTRFPEGIYALDQIAPVGKIRSLYYGPDLLGSISLGAYLGESDTEKVVRANWESGEPYRMRDITRLVIEGWPGNHSTRDRIEIAYTNQHGVTRETVIVFDDLD